LDYPSPSRELHVWVLGMEVVLSLTLVDFSPADPPPPQKKERPKLDYSATDQCHMLVT
jgi:hypothetical protein